MIIEDLEKKLNCNQLSPLYLLYGEERYLLELNLKKIKKIFGKIIYGINYVTIDETNLRRNNFRN